MEEDLRGLCVLFIWLTLPDNVPSH